MTPELLHSASVHTWIEPTHCLKQAQNPSTLSLAHLAGSRPQPQQHVTSSSTCEVLGKGVSAEQNSPACSELERSLNSGS